MFESQDATLRVCVQLRGRLALISSARGLLRRPDSYIGPQICESLQIEFNLGVKGICSLAALPCSGVRQLSTGKLDPYQQA